MRPASVVAVVAVVVVVVNGKLDQGKRARVLVVRTF